MPFSSKSKFHYPLVAIAMLFTVSTPPNVIAADVDANYALNQGLKPFHYTVTRAELLNPVKGVVSQAKPQAVQLVIINGPAKGCIISGSAYLNQSSMRYQFQLKANKCSQQNNIGLVVRGQHGILGTMANSGMGRSYLVSNKGVQVTLAKK